MIPDIVSRSNLYTALDWRQGFVLGLLYIVYTEGN